MGQKDPWLSTTLGQWSQKANVERTHQLASLVCVSTHLLTFGCSRECELFLPLLWFLGKSNTSCKTNDIFFGNQGSWEALPRLILISYYSQTSRRQPWPSPQPWPAASLLVHHFRKSIAGASQPHKVPTGRRSKEVTELGARPSIQSQICLLPCDSGQPRAHSLLPEGQRLAPQWLFLRSSNFMFSTSYIWQ